MEPNQHVTRRRATLGGLIGFALTFVVITMAAIALNVDGGLAVVLGVMIGVMGAGLGALVGVAASPDQPE